MKPADEAALTLWQQLRNMGLTPEERIERMVRDALAPFVSRDEYEETLNQVRECMR